MNYRITYQPAKTVSEAIESHFAEQHAAAPEKEVLAPLPFKDAVEVMLDVVFWASLRKEEGHSHKISIAFLPPEDPGQPLKFNSRLSLNTSALTKLAPAVEQPGIHLGVWYDDNGFFVWGATRELPDLCFVLEVIEPGALVVKHRRMEGYGKFYNVAILKGDEIKLIDADRSIIMGCPDILSSMLSFSPGDAGERNLLIQLAISIRAHKRGGTLLIVPSKHNHWRTSIIEPINYFLEPPFAKLSQMLQQLPDDKDEYAWTKEIQTLTEGIAGLTAVDGAMIINDKYDVYAFGAKIGYSTLNQRIDRVQISEPVRGNEPKVVHPAKLGGTRHLSAAQFVHDQHDCLAMVASQDGRFTIFSWSNNDNMVNAYRIDALLY